MSGFATCRSGSSAVPYVIQADTVRGYEGNLQGTACVPEGAFSRGEGVVFRVRLTDAETREQLTRTIAEKRGITVPVHVEGVSPIPAVVIPHPPRASQETDYWTALWTIPRDYPAGNAPWGVVVRDAQAKGLTPGDEVRLVWHGEAPSWRMMEGAFLDTNVAVYAVDRSAGDKRAKAQALFTESIEPLVMSAQVLNAFYLTVTRKLRVPLESTIAFEAVRSLARLTVVPLDADMTLTSIDLSQQHRISLWDANFVACAARAGYDRILTEDLHRGPRILGVEIVDSFR